MHQLVMTSCRMRLALLAVVLGASVSDSARPMNDVTVPPLPSEVSSLCLRDKPCLGLRPFGSRTAPNLTTGVTIIEEVL